MAERRNGVRAGRWLLALAAGAFLALALDGRLYWHDVRYLYATSHYSLSQLFAGVWNPQYGEPLDPAASGAFYLVKIAWLALLQAVWAVRAPDAGGLELAMGLSLASVALSAPALAWVLRRALPDRPAWLATGSAALLWVSPTLPYLAGKLLAEALALPLELLAIGLALGALGGGRRAPLAAAALAHGVAVCARPNIGVLAVGFFAAWAWRPPSASARATRGPALRLAAAALGLQALAHVVLFAASGVGWAGFEGYVREFVAGHRSIWISVLGTLAAGGALWPLAGLAWGSAQRAEARFLGLWFGLCALPTFAVVSLYQVEARYLIAPLVPLAALACLGAARLVARLGGRLFAVAGVALAVVAADALALSVLPYEVEKPELEALLESPELEAPGASLLVPWAYSDFHYLVTVAPRRRIYFVHVPRHDGALQPYTAEWQQRLATWYGDRVLAGVPALRARLREGPVYYLAWGVHPPLERWARRLRGAGLPGLAERVRTLGGMRHDDQSWVVDVPGLRRQTVRESGIYRLERLSLPPAPDASAPAASAP